MRADHHDALFALLAPASATTRPPLPSLADLADAAPDGGWTAGSLADDPAVSGAAWLRWTGWGDLSDARRAYARFASERADPPVDAAEACARAARTHAFEETVLYDLAVRSVLPARHALGRAFFGDDALLHAIHLSTRPCAPYPGLAVAHHWRAERDAGAPLAGVGTGAVERLLAALRKRGDGVAVG